MFYEALCEELRFFISLMNPSRFIIVDWCEGRDNIKRIKFYMDKLNLTSIDDCFVKVWDDMDIDFMVPFDICFNTLLLFLDNGFRIKTLESILRKFYGES